MKDETVIDEQLETLEDAADGLVARPHLAPILEHRYGPEIRIADVQVEIVRQRLKRCVLLYRVRLEPAAAHREGECLELYGKVFRPGVGPEIYDKMRDLWDRGFDGDAADGIGIPEALAFVPELELLVLQAVGGRSFKECLIESGSPSLMRRVARAFVKLHAQRDWPGPLFRLDRHVDRCHPKYPQLAEALPELADAIESIVREACERESHYSDAEFGAIHGDLHLSQILIDSERAHLIDLDDLARGDPASDLANFLVFLRSKRKVPRLDELEAAFLEEYFTRMDAAIADRIPVYEAITHVRRACKDLRFSRPGWQERAANRIAQGLACLELD